MVLVMKNDQEFTDKICKNFNKRLGKHTHGCLGQWANVGHGEDTGSIVSSVVRLEVFFRDAITKRLLSKDGEGL